MNKIEHDKLAYTKFTDWLKVELLKCDEYGEEFVKELKDGTSGYSDVEDDGDYLHKAKNELIISESEFGYLWEEYITGPVVMTGIIATLFDNYAGDELPKSWLDQRVIDVRWISYIFNETGRWRSKCGDLTVDVVGSGHKSISLVVINSKGDIIGESIVSY